MKLLNETIGAGPMAAAASSRLELPQSQSETKPNGALARSSTSTPEDVQLRAEAEKGKLPELVERAVKLSIGGVQVYLQLALSSCIIRLVEPDAFVDQIVEGLLKDLRKRHGARAPKLTTAKSLCRYTAPLLEWLRRSNPKLRQITKKLLMSYLRKEPTYLLAVTEDQLVALALDCGDLAGLVEKYGPGEVALDSKAETPVAAPSPAKPEPVAPVSQALAAQPSPPKPAKAKPAAAKLAADTKKSSKTPPTAPSPVTSQQQPTDMTDDEAIPSNDGLLEIIYAVGKYLDLMKEEGIPIQADAKAALLKACVCARDKNAYFAP
jgi:hypothetical protein